MDSLELREEISMSYDELVQYLLKKYGAAKYDYFCTPKCRSVNSKKLSRTDEGLVCHHIDEDKVSSLSSNKLAHYYSFEYQKADRLVYCNQIEHLLLHIKICNKEYGHGFQESNFIDVEGYLLVKPSLRKYLSQGVCDTSAVINDLFENSGSEKKYLNNCFKVISNNFEDYIEVLRLFYNIIDEDYIRQTTINVNEKGSMYKAKMVFMENRLEGYGVVTAIRPDAIIMCYNNINYEIYYQSNGYKISESWTLTGNTLFFTDEKAKRAINIQREEIKNAVISTYHSGVSELVASRLKGI